MNIQVGSILKTLVPIGIRAEYYERLFELDCYPIGTHFVTTQAELRLDDKYIDIAYKVIKGGKIVENPRGRLGSEWRTIEVRKFFELFKLANSLELSLNKVFPDRLHKHLQVINKGL